MRIYIHPVRRDGRHLVSLIYENGRRIDKYLTPDQTREQVEKSKADLTLELVSGLTFLPPEPPKP